VIQRLPVRIRGKLVDIKGTDLVGHNGKADPQKIQILFDRLNLTLPVDIEASEFFSLHQKQLNKISAAVDVDSINWGLFLEVLGDLVDGKTPDWSKWNQLEHYQAATQPIIEERTLTKTDTERGWTKENYFASYYQNLKDKGMDYEKLVNDFVNKNQYGMGLAEAHAIFGYTTVLFYKKLNELMRGGDTGKTDMLRALLESALSRLPLQKAPQYRGIDVPIKELGTFLLTYTKGALITDAQFQSAAQYKVQPFWGRANVRMEIRPANARDISELAFGTHFIAILTQNKSPNDSQETLFPPGKFLVEAVEESEENLPGKDPRKVYSILLKQVG